MKLSKNWIIGGVALAGAAAVTVPPAAEFIGDRLDGYKEANCTESMPGCSPKSTFNALPKELGPVLSTIRQDVIGDLIQASKTAPLPTLAPPKP